MKRKKVRIIIEVYDCGTETHRHATESGARRCVETRRLTRRWTKFKQQLHEKHMKAIKMVLNGQSYKAAGAVIGRSGSRIREIIENALRKLSHPANKDREMNARYNSPHMITLNVLREDPSFWYSRIEKMHKLKWWHAPDRKVFPRPLEPTR